METVTGAEGKDYINAASNNVAVSIDGGLGSDTIIGSVVGDSLLGGAGNDHFVFYGTSQLFNGNTLFDTVEGGADVDTVIIEGGPVVISNTQSFIDMSGVERLAVTGAVGGNISMVFNASAFDVAGIRNIDISQATGATLNNVDASAAKLGQDLVVIGSDAADTLIGGAGNDAVTGGDGNDVITGGAGSDTLQGGRGVDTYELSANETVATRDVVIENGSAVNFIGNINGRDVYTAMDVLNGFIQSIDVLQMSGTLQFVRGNYTAIDNSFAVDAAGASTLVFNDLDANGLDAMDTAVVLVGVTGVGPTGIPNIMGASV